MRSAIKKKINSHDKKLRRRGDEKQRMINTEKIPELQYLFGESRMSLGQML